jgi:hypothetical protein
MPCLVFSWRGRAFSPISSVSPIPGVPTVHMFPTMPLSASPSASRSRVSVLRVVGEPRVEVARSSPGRGEVTFRGETLSNFLLDAAAQPIIHPTLLSPLSPLALSSSLQYPLGRFKFDCHPRRPQRLTISPIRRGSQLTREAIPARPAICFLLPGHREPPNRCTRHCAVLRCTTLLCTPTALPSRTASCESREPHRSNCTSTCCRPTPSHADHLLCFRLQLYFHPPTLV